MLNLTLTPPVGSTIATLERGQRVISAIHKRLHYAQRTEFKILKRIFGEVLPLSTHIRCREHNKPYLKKTLAIKLMSSLYLILIFFSTTQRIILAQTQLQMAQSAPQVHNLKAAFRKMYLALNIKDIDDILAPDVNPAPKDPIQEKSGFFKQRFLASLYTTKP